jgi:hypothetical protein
MNEENCKVCGTDHLGDEPCCPRCRHHNAMLPHREKVLPDKRFRRCRDCGYVEME